jgi:hypothetical protein
MLIKHHYYSRTVFLRTTGGMLVLAARYNFGRRLSDMKTRTILAAVGLVRGIVAIQRSVAAKEATVTLAISGMT